MRFVNENPLKTLKYSRILKSPRNQNYNFLQIYKKCETRVKKNMYKIRVFDRGFSPDHHPPVRGFWKSLRTARCALGPLLRPPFSASRLSPALAFLMSNKFALVCISGWSLEQQCHMSNVSVQKDCTVKQVLIDHRRAIFYALVSIIFWSCGEKILKTFPHMSLII